MLASTLTHLVVWTCSRRRLLLTPGWPYPVGVPCLVALHSTKLLCKHVILGDVRDLSNIICVPMPTYSVLLGKGIKYLHFFRLHVFLKALEIL